MPPAQAADELHLYNWNNYIAPETVSRFEASCKCKVVQTYYGDNEEMLAKLAAGATGYDIIVPTGNALVITDYADNLQRIDRIIASLDVPPAGEPIIVPLRNASAVDMVQVLNRLLADTPGAQGGVPDLQQRVSVVADPRSNSLLVRADSPTRLARTRA